MALHDLINSIVLEADQQIAAAKEAHSAHLKDMASDHNAKLEKVRKTTQDRLNQKKRSLREKAESLGRISAGKQLLLEKNAAVDALYDRVLADLSSLPKAELREFLAACLKQVGDEGGTLHPAPVHADILRELAKDMTIGAPLKHASGGFTVASAKREWNFTFEFLVRDMLRPATEIDAASQLLTA